MTSGYQIRYRRAAASYLKRLPARECSRIIESIEALAEDIQSRVLDVKKLRDRSGYRMRVGRFRIIFDRNDKESIIRILAIRSRGDVYKG
jgi:mRNA interferase RelE/StbE